MIQAAREKTTHQLTPRVDISHVTRGTVLADSEQAHSWYKLVRQMRRDPTIALVRTLIVAPPLAAGWTVQSTKDAPDGAKEYIQEQMDPMRQHIIRQAMLGCTDFGWQPFEKVFELRDDRTIGIKKIKSLIQDNTCIRVIRKNGNFNGFYQPYVDVMREVYLPLNKSLLYNFDVEGTNWYGNATMRNVEGPYVAGLATEESSKRYDDKIAGAHWVIHYPIGASELNGVETDNYQIALTLKTELQSTGILIVPREVERWKEDLNEQRSDEAWKIEIISPDASDGTYFIEKSKYYESLKVRGLGFPERSVTEGQHGTKAEAGEHGDFALINVELRHDEIIQTTNWHLVNQLLVMNYGEGTENTVFLRANPLNDEKKQILKGVYDRILSSPELIKAEYLQTDMTVVRELLEVPENENFNEDLIPVILEQVKAPPQPISSFGGDEETEEEKSEEEKSEEEKSEEESEEDS